MLYADYRCRYEHYYTSAYGMNGKKPSTQRAVVWAVRAPVRKFFLCRPRGHICLPKGCISVKARQWIRSVSYVAGLLHTIGVKLRWGTISVIICLCWYRYIDPRKRSYVYRRYVTSLLRNLRARCLEERWNGFFRQFTHEILKERFTYVTQFSRILVINAFWAPYSEW